MVIWKFLTLSYHQIKRFSSSLKCLDKTLSEINLALDHLIKNAGIYIESDKFELNVNEIKNNGSNEI